MKEGWLVVIGIGVFVLGVCAGDAISHSVLRSDCEDFGRHIYHDPAYGDWSVTCIMRNHEK